MLTVAELEAEVSMAIDRPMPSFQPMEGGLDAGARNYRSGDAFVKVRRDVPSGVRLAMELAIPEVLAPERVVELSDGAWALVYPFVDGKDGFAEALRPGHWEAVGRTLRQVHDRQDLRCSLEPETFTVLGAGTLHESPLSHRVAAHWETLAPFIEMTLDLGRRMSEQKWGFVACHADLHVGNVLTARDRVWIVDWDTARLAPRECDLVFFVEGGILNRHGAAEEAAFFRGYGEVEISADLIRYYRFARLLEDFVSFAQDGDEAWFQKQLESPLLASFRTL